MEANTCTTYGYGCDIGEGGGSNFEQANCCPTFFDQDTCAMAVQEICLTIAKNNKYSLNPDEFKKDLDTLERCTLTLLGMNACCTAISDDSCRLVQETIELRIIEEKPWSCAAEQQQYCPNISTATN